MLDKLLIFFLLLFTKLTFPDNILFEISLILASAISKINLFLIFLKFRPQKTSFSIKSSFFKSGVNEFFFKIFLIVSFFNETTFEISLIIISLPKSNDCSNLKELFSK